MLVASSQALRRACALAFTLFLAGLVAAACSAGDPVQPDQSASAQTTTPSSDSEEPSTEVRVAETPTPTPVPAPTLADEDLASVTDLGSGEQAQDAQGNRLAIYGFVEWSEPFEALSDQAQASFPFFGDVDDLADPSVELVALDIGMCSAGIDATGFGTAEFFVHDSPADLLSADPVQDRGVLARHPVMQPGFSLPASAECTRGWLPVLWSGTEPPTTARYVLTTRQSSDAEIERHVYQWDLEPAAPADAMTDDLFGIGQTVTFNDGRLAETSVVVDGWAEFVGQASSIDGARVVGVSLTYCPSSLTLPEFGLSVDGWNLIAPVAGSDLLGAASAADPTQNCFDGWLEFVVPFGGVPTGFFASDGANAVAGYAEWSLTDAALPAPPPASG